MSRISTIFCLLFALWWSDQGRAAVVSGKVVMPDVCSPDVSPAVVVLKPNGFEAGAHSTVASPAPVALINQRGLQFVPRVQAIALGRTLRFTNNDNETHNVHILSPGNAFNESMPPGQAREFTPTKPGVVRLACDVHSHMRGYVVVSESPWVRVCSAKGNFRLDDVPDGKYTLTVWHEMGDPLTTEVTVEGVEAVDLGTLTLTAPAPAKLGPGVAAPVRSWPDVIDRIGLLLSSSLGAASRSDGFKKARKLAEDSYWGEFESSDFETAVRLHLGLARATELERRFRAIVPALRAMADGRGREQAIDATRQLLLALTKAGDELNKKGVIDAAHLGNSVAAQPARVEPGSDAEHSTLLRDLRHGLDGVRVLAERGEVDDAASAMTEVYFDQFEPIERFIAVHEPLAVRPLEDQFLAIRGEIGTGLLKGESLSERLDALQGEAKAALNRGAAQSAGAFGPAFGLSFVTILREGVEVILLLTMLLALAAKTGQARARRAIAWGVALAVLASAATALGLNLMVSSAQGRMREVVEGGVMLVAAVVLFYVSYWLISQSESKRWMAFLKRHAARGVSSGPWGSFALLSTAFLAVYREGAETALMYQAMIGSQAGSRVGLSGLAVGLGVGLVVLSLVACLIWATGVRLPLRAFFQATGAVLFAMAVVFAGNGVHELQASSILKITPLTWLGAGLPVLGMHPNVQVLSVQAVLLAGALLALIVLTLGDPIESPLKSAGAGGKPAAGVGV